MIALDIKPVCFISSSSEDLDKASKIEAFLEREGIEATTWKNSFFPGMTLVENLKGAISKADSVILMIPSNGSNAKSREDMFLEIGVIVGMNKPLLTLAQKDNQVELPYNMSSSLYLHYEPNQIESSFRYIRNWAMQATAVAL